MKKRLLSVFLSIVAIIGASAALHQAAKQPRPDRTATTTHVTNTANTFSVPQTPVTPQAIGTSAADYESITDWVSVGTVKYTDCVTIQAEYYGYNTYDVDLEESESNPGLYRVKNPVLNNPGLYDGDADTSTDYYMIVDATDPDAVFIPECAYGLIDYYSGEMIYVRSQSTGTITDNTVTFPEWGLSYKIGQSGSWTVCSGYGYNFSLNLPGAKDYTMSLKASNTCNAQNQAQFNISAGSDITVIKYALGADLSESDATEQARTSGNTLQSGSNAIELPAEGIYTLAIVGYDSEGNEQATATSKFYRFDENADQWQSLGLAQMTEDLVNCFYASSGNYYGPNTYDVEVQENIATPGYYRIVNPFDENPNDDVYNYNYHSLDHRHYIFIHAENPEAVTISESPIGENFYNEGDIIVYPYGTGTMENGVITMPAGSINVRMGNYSTTNKNNFIVVIPKEHTIKVKSSDENYGTVAITSPATEGNTITTTESSVTVTATPNEGVNFINWTDADGNVISTETAYTYVGSEDIELTANFGLSLTYTFPENGYMAVTVNGSTVSSGTILAPGTTIDIKLTPANKYELESFTINGNNIEPNEDGTYSFALTEATVINATFAKIGHTLTIITKGNGRVEVWSSFDESDDSPAGTQYQSGDKIPNEELIYVYYFPGSEASESETRYEQISSATLSTSAGTINMLSDGYLFAPGFDSNAFTNQENILAESDITISTEFTNDYAALEEIGIDTNNGPVEYYNLQGIRISSDNLTPGFYIIRQGSKAAKVLITK